MVRFEDGKQRLLLEEKRQRTNGPATLRALVILALLALSGCRYMSPTYWELSSSLDKYKAVENRVELGHSKEKVLGLLLPTQEGLPSGAGKSPDKFVRDGKNVEIYYMRSGWVQDGRTTDDEFTPYVFENGVLKSIGWEALGGPKVTHNRSCLPATPHRPNATELLWAA
jgi:hypothetical protein